MKECTGLPKDKAGEFDQFASSAVLPEKEFIFIRLWGVSYNLSASSPFTVL